MLKREGIQHNVLNAKNHEKEAEIVAQAGKLGAVTIATNMAGRGTDIMLGGNAEYLAKADMREGRLRRGADRRTPPATPRRTTRIFWTPARPCQELDREIQGRIIKPEAEKVRAAGGLFIIGTERHESRRIDNQLRGRSGRQGDPGETRFYISLEDDLMRLFGGDRIKDMMDKLDLEEDIPIENKVLSNCHRKRPDAPWRAATSAVPEDRSRVRRRHEPASARSSTPSAVRCWTVWTSRRPC